MALYSESFLKELDAILKADEEKNQRLAEAEARIASAEARIAEAEGKSAYAETEVSKTEFVVAALRKQLLDAF